MKKSALLNSLGFLMLCFTMLASAGETRVALRNGKWFINDQITYPGSSAEGLLMNVRMVNAVFEDERRPDFDPEANAEEFVQQIPDYKAHGVRAFTLCLQGGMPGYEGAVNSAFKPDGALKTQYMARVRRVIEACDRQGCAVILGCYYQRQCSILKDDAAIRAGVTGVARWIKDGGFQNVMLEVANEYPHKGFAARPLLRSPQGEAELIALAKKTAPGVLVSTSGYGDGKLDDEVAKASDFLLIHFNGVKNAKIPDCVAALRQYRKAIVCNEDVELGDEGARVAETCVGLGVSWGCMNEPLNQSWPFRFKGAADDPKVYAKLKALTTAP